MPYLPIDIMPQCCCSQSCMKEAKKNILLDKLLSYYHLIKYTNVKHKISNHKNINNSNLTLSAPTQFFLYTSNLQGLAIQ